MLRAKLVDIVETTRSESPVPISGSSPLSGRGGKAYYSRTRTGSGSPGEGGSEEGRVALPGLAPHRSLRRNLSHACGRNGSVSSRSPMWGSWRGTVVLNLSRGNSCGGPGEGPVAPREIGSAVQEGIGSVSVSQSGRGVILSSTRGASRASRGLWTS